MKKLGIFGAGGHAKVVADTAIRTGAFDVVAFYDDADHRRGLPFYLQRPIRGGREQLLTDARAGIIDAAFVAIGNNDARTTIGESLLGFGVELAALIDPNAIVSPSATIERGTLVVAGAIINADTRIERHVIINTGASVDHDCVVGAGVHIGPHATLCGGVHIGPQSLIGAGSTLIPTVHFPAGSILGAGSTLIATATLAGTWTGSPAIRSRSV